MSEFTREVMAGLIKHKVYLHGSKPEALEADLDGSLKIWYSGHRNGKPFRAALSLVPDASVAAAIASGDSDTVVEVCRSFIDHQQGKYY